MLCSVLWLAHKIGTKFLKKFSKCYHYSVKIEITHNLLHDNFKYL